MTDESTEMPEIRSIIAYYNKDGDEIEQEEWSKLFGQDDYKRIAFDTVEGAVNISTVWLGLDHNYYPGGMPLIFETMVFGGVEDHWQDRYNTFEQAVEGHKDAVVMVQLAERAAREVD